MNLATNCGCSFAVVHHLRVISGVLVALVFPGTQALAGGWSLNSTASERVTYDDNLRQVSNGSADTYGSTTSLNTDLGWRSPRTNVNLKADFDLNRYVGPGGTSDLDTLGQFYEGRIKRKSKTANIEFSSSYRIQDTTFSEVDDTGILSQNKNNRLTFSTNGKTTYNINRRLKSSLAGSVEYVDFSVQTASLTPFLNVELTGDVVRKLTRSSEATFSLGWNYFKSDDLTSTASHTGKASGELKTRLSPRLTARVLAGVNVTSTDEKATLTTAASSSTTVGGLFELGLDYTLADTQISFVASRGLSPSAAGEVRQSDNIGISVTHQINRRSRISAAINGRLQTSLSGSNGTNLKFFTIAPTYSYSIARNWDFSVGYNFRFQDSDGVTSKSNSVFVLLTRNLPLLR